MGEARIFQLGQPGVLARYSHSLFVVCLSRQRGGSYPTTCSYPSSESGGVDPLHKKLNKKEYRSHVARYPDTRVP
eukprot:1349075-Rhodomonas_salina.3